eukprot:ANDGO_08577.mRNA.1 CSC1-like protein ERD4
MSELDVSLLTVFAINIVCFVLCCIAFWVIVKNRKRVIKNFLRFLPSVGSQIELDAMNASGMDDSSIDDGVENLSPGNHNANHRHNDDEKAKLAHSVSSTRLTRSATQPTLRIFGVPILHRESVDSLRGFFRIASVDDVLRLAGHDAAVYTVLQRALVGFMSFVALISLVVVLPLHVTADGSDQAETDADTQKSVYMTTTIDQVMKNKDILWIHCLLAVLFTLAGFCCVAYFQRHEATTSLTGGQVDFRSSESLFFQTPTALSGPVNSDYGEEMEDYAKPVADSEPEHDHAERVPAAPQLTGRISKYAIMLLKIPTTVTSDEELASFVLHILNEGSLRKASTYRPIAAADIVSARLAHDTRKLVKADKKLRTLREKWVVANGDWQRSEEHVRPKIWMLTSLPPFFRKVDAIKIYERRMRRAYDELKAGQEYYQSNPECTNIGFIVFRSLEIAEYASSALYQHVNVLEHGSLSVRPAPEPSDVLWQNLNIDRHEKLCRIAAVQTVLITILFFFSTPLAVVQSVVGFVSGASVVPSFAYTFLPSLLLLIVILVLPIIIEFLTNLEGHRLHSTVMYNVYARNYVYFLLSSLILPMISLTLVDAIRTFESTNNWNDTLDNVFLPKAGSFFLAYVIQVSFLGNAIDMLRVGETFYRAVTTKKPISGEEERILDRMSPFEYQVHTPFMVSIVAISLTYALLTPLIALVGWFFLVCKYFVDQYNLLTVHPPSESGSLSVSHRIYREKLLLLCRFVFAAMIVFESYMMYFFAIKGVQGPFAIMLVVLLITVIILLGWYSNLGKRGAFASLNTDALTQTDDILDPDFLQVAYVAPPVRVMEPFVKFMQKAPPSAFPPVPPVSASSRSNSVTHSLNGAAVSSRLAIPVTETEAASAV